MYCHNCGTKLSKGSRFCSSCGHSIAETSRGAQTFQHEHKSPIWFRILTAVFIIAILGSVWYWYNSEELEDVVENQLKSIRNNKITEAYYKYTAKSFQETTSLENFREFINSYPVLKDNRSFILNEKDIENSIGSLTGKLISNDEEAMNVAYQLMKEGGRWKIVSIRLKERMENDPISLTLTQDLLTPIDAQLKILKNRDISSAYYGFASQEFQKNTPIKKFQLFVKNYPIFFNYDHIEYQKRSIENNIGNVQLVLTEDDESYPIDYQLIKEDGKWKIWSLKLGLDEQLAPGEELQDPQLLNNPVEVQLQSLSNEDVDTAYYATSSAFQDETPLPAFTKFVQNFPILTDHKTVEFKEGIIEEGVGTLQVIFRKPNTLTEVEYTLRVEDGEWKILGLEILDHIEEPSKKEVSQLNTQPLLDIVHSHLNAIKEGNNVEAYNRYTADEFKDSVSFSDFEDFLLENPQFARHLKAQFKKVRFNQNTGTLKGTIISWGNEAFIVEYDLVEDDNGWKISHVDVRN